MFSFGFILMIKGPCPIYGKKGLFVPLFQRILTKGFGTFGFMSFNRSSCQGNHMVKNFLT